MGSLNGIELGWQILLPILYLDCLEPYVESECNFVSRPNGLSTSQECLLRSAIGPVQEAQVYVILGPEVRGSRWLIKAG